MNRFATYVTRKKDRSHDGGVGLSTSRWQGILTTSDRGVGWAFERFVRARDDKQKLKRLQAGQRERGRECFGSVEAK
jgi:hypothetical protein